MKKKSLFLCLFSFVIVAFSCVKDSREVSAPSVPLPDGISAVKSFFDSEIGLVSLPDGSRIAGAAGGAAATRGAGGAALLTATSTPDWSGATTYRDGEMEVVQVPLDQSSEIIALVRMTDSLGNVVHTKKQVATWLLVGTDAGGHRRTMTATVIPGKHYLAPQDSDPQSATMYTTHDLRGTDFTGTVLYATPEGRLIQGRNYDDGQVVGTLWLRGDYQLLAAREEEEKIAENEDYPGLVHARGHANGNHGNAYGHDKENNGRGHAYGRQRQIGTAAIELVDERAATPGYVLSFEGGWGPNPGDDGWGDLDPIVVTPGDDGGDLPPWVCPVCHDPACDGDCWVDEPDPEDDPYDPIVDDPGSGGGGVPPPSSTPLARAILKGNLTETQWQSVERMIDKILEDCMSSHLDNGLIDKMNGATWELRYDPWAANAQFSGSAVMINNLNDPYALMHELFHGYQAYGESADSFNGAIANLEVEAQIAKVMFMLNGNDLDEYTQNYQELRRDPNMDSFRFLQENLTSRGLLANPATQSDFDRVFYETGQAYVRKDPALYRWDNLRTSSGQNMKNIVPLAAGC